MLIPISYGRVLDRMFVIWVWVPSARHMTSHQLVTVSQFRPQTLSSLMLRQGSLFTALVLSHRVSEPRLTLGLGCSGRQK
eukprot:1257413-Rhodomonas_salina.1